MVVTHSVTGEQLHIGMDLPAVPILREALEYAENSGCDFVLASLVHPRYERPNPLPIPGSTPANVGKTLPYPIQRQEPLTRSDLELNSGEWMAGVIGKLSGWFKLDSTEPQMRRKSEMAYREEVELAAHLSLRAAVVNAPNPMWGLTNFASTTLAILSSVHNTQIWIRLPVGRSDAAIAAIPMDKNKRNMADTWEMWNVIRCMCDNHPNLGVALEVASELPPKEELDRWIAEPVRLLIISTAAFVTNRVGYPVLSRRHQDLVKQMFKYRPFFALSGRPQHNVKGGEGIRPYVQYLGHLFGKQPASTEAEMFEQPYRDLLQAPLQPLADNLESQTYETFEKDPVKYTKYQEAIALFFKEKALSEATVFILGAGRGPLVRTAIRAAESAMTLVKIYAVEKNPYAVITLQNMKNEFNLKNVTVIKADARQWEAGVKADLIVSELLGSFGDNELAPECLANVSNMLKEGGSCIPMSYTSYIAPCSSTKIYNEVRQLGGQNMGHFETPFVVSIHRGMDIAPAQQCFTFECPTLPEADNSRMNAITFEVNANNIIHGLSGYFEATLYGEVTISIRPETMSEGMFSWFPYFFPLREPIYVLKGSTVEINIWRKTTKTKVWYEWCVSKPSVSPIHNPGGRSYVMNLDS